jgi:hypothetical protein
MIWSQHLGLAQDLRHCCLSSFLKLVLLCANFICLPYVGNFSFLLEDILF